MEFPVGPGELSIIGTGGITFQEKRDVIVYDNRNVILVQTSSSNYQPGDKIELRVVATNEQLIPLENVEVLVEIYVCLEIFYFKIIKYIIFNSRMLILNSLVNFHPYLFILVKRFV